MENDHRNQRHYRILLQAMSRPGRVFRQDRDDAVSSVFPVLAIAGCLLDREVTFCVLENGDGKALHSAIVSTTGARPAMLSQADFIFVQGTPGGYSILSAKHGSLEFPEEGATVVYCVDERRPAASDRFRVRLSGPGIAGDMGIAPEMKGIALEDLLELQAANADYPLGVDAVFTRGNGELMCIPRSTRIHLR